MTKVNSLLAKRLQSPKNTKKNKMTTLANQSASGNLSSFTGIFSIEELCEKEKKFLEILLHEHAPESANVSEDLFSLISITSEVKAINNQAALLHGERIKKVQTLLKNYQEGAFSGWLITTYGNRQTPYNFLQYHEFWQTMPLNLRPQIENMPRQAIYTLASRSGSVDKKKEIIKNYQGESKNELLTLIREYFPLSDSDKRKRNPAESLIKKLQELQDRFSKKTLKMTKKQKNKAAQIIKNLEAMLF